MNIVAVRERPQVIQFKQQDETYEQQEEFSAVREEPVPAVIKVVSAGGGGANALNRMIDSGLSGVQFIAVNTDIQDLRNKSKANTRVQIGVKVTGGRGAGGVPDKGEKAAIEDQDTLAEVLAGADMVFITAGMGGGTGTGSAPVIAKIAKEQGALTVAVVTTPFEFEGRYKMKLAEEGIAKLRDAVDTLIVIPNQYLFKLVDNNTSWDDAYVMADKVLCQGVQGISELITKTGFMNTDFADVETIMKGKGDALMGIGVGSGDNRAMDAVTNAIDNPLLEDTNIEGASGVLINITGPKDIKIVEINNMIKSIKEKCDPNVHLIHGLRIDPELDNTIQITVIATGFAGGTCSSAKTTVDKKFKDSDFIRFDEFARMRERTKRPDYLPPKDYQDDLDVPSVIRNFNFNTDDTACLEAQSAESVQIIGR
jgi:cell division protein FtsZ